MISFTSIQLRVECNPNGVLLWQLLPVPLQVAVYRLFIGCSRMAVLIAVWGPFLVVKHSFEPYIITFTSLYYWNKWWENLIDTSDILVCFGVEMRSRAGLLTHYLKLLQWTAHLLFWHTAGKISIEHVTIFSKYISKGAIDIHFSPDVGNNPSNLHIQRNKQIFSEIKLCVIMWNDTRKKY